MTISLDDYNRSVASYDQWTRKGDDTLYGLCRQNPHHTDHGSVAAKCWIIGRSYATGIERQIKSSGQQGNSMSKLVVWLVSHAVQVDRLIDRLLPMRNPLTADSLATILDVHGRFVRLLSGVVRSDETPRAFASKYLHFHCSLVPIYDSVVAGIIPRFVRWHKGLIVFPKPANADDQYARFCYRFLNLYERARAIIGNRIRVKLLDYHMLVLGGGPQ